MSISLTVWPRVRKASSVAAGKRPRSTTVGPLKLPKFGRSIARCASSPQSSVPTRVLAVKWMMAAPPGEPRLISSLPSRWSKTSVGLIDERGRLPGCTRLAMGLPSASAGAIEKSVNSLLSKKPPTLPLPPSLIRRAPNTSSIVVVIATARPSASTIEMWLVPTSGCSGCGAKAIAAPGGTPGLAVCMLCGLISAARCFRYASSNRLVQRPAGAATKSGSATYCARSA